MRTVLSLSFLILTGCPQPTNCTTEARSSVSVNVVDENGEPILNAELTYSVDGGPSLDCEIFGDGSSVCGWEASGEIAITATAQGYQSASETVTVESDECHVISESLTLTLTEVQCPPPGPSVIAEVSAEGYPDGTLPNDAHIWVSDGTSEVPIECWVQGDAESGVQYACGEGLAGDLEIWGEAPGFGSEIVSVHVDADECGPITENIGLLLHDDCSDEDDTAEPSVFVLVSAAEGIDGAIPEDTEVTITDLEADIPSELCTMQGADLTGVTFYCGSEQAGNFQITASANGGLSQASAAVLVENDECGDVVPGYVELTLPVVD